MTASSPRSRYIDSSGNEITRATYESLLAQNILEHPEFWKDVYDKFNKKLVELIEYNKGNYSFNEGIEEGIYFLSRTFPQIRNTTDLINEFKEQKIKDDYPNRFKFNSYKFIVERAFPYAKILPDSHLLKGKAEDEKSGLEAGSTYITAMRQKGSTLWRPDELFGYHTRGRTEANSPGSRTSPSGGITSEVAAHSKLKNKFKDHPSNAAKIQYTRIKNSPTIQQMEKHDIPFGAGTSGTLAFLVDTFDYLFGKELSAEDYKKVFMGLCAHLVIEGHHSFAEVGMIINAVKGRNPNAFAIDPALKAKEYYDQYLTESYRTSDAYHEFYTTYHPSKYTAMKWQILRDAVFEYEKNRSWGESGEDPVIKQLSEFSEKNKDKSDELSPEDINQLKSILTKAKEEKPVARRDELVNKLIKKLEDSGIPLKPPAITPKERKKTGSPTSKERKTSKYAITPKSTEKKETKVATPISKSKEKKEAKSTESVKKKITRKSFKTLGTKDFEITILTPTKRNVGKGLVEEKVSDALADIATSIPKEDKLSVEIPKENTENTFSPRPVSPEIVNETSQTTRSGLFQSPSNELKQDAELNELTQSATELKKLFNTTIKNISGIQYLLSFVIPQNTHVALKQAVEQLDNFLKTKQIDEALVTALKNASSVCKESSKEKTIISEFLNKANQIKLEKKALGRTP